MKKILVIFICVIVMCALPVVAFAEDSTSAEEIVTVEAVFEEIDDPNELSFEDITLFLGEHWEKLVIACFVTIVETLAKRRNTKLDKTITTANNNAVEIANTSNTSAANMKKAVEKYEAMMDKKLAEFTKKIEGINNYLNASRLANKILGDEIAKLLVLANVPNSVKDELYATHVAAMNGLLEIESLLESEESEEAEEVKENEEAID